MLLLGLPILLLAVLRNLRRGHRELLYILALVALAVLSVCVLGKLKIAHCVCFTVVRAAKKVACSALR